MSTIKEPQSLQAGQTVSDEYRKRVKSGMPAMAALLDKLDSGVSPNFLDILAAISDLVAFYTECDLDLPDPVEKNILMSGKFCRFCC